MLHTILVLVTSLVAGAALFGVLVVMMTSRNVFVLLAIGGYLALTAGAWFLVNYALGRPTIPDQSGAATSMLVLVGLIGISVMLYARRRAPELASLGAFFGGAGGLGAIIAILLSPPPMYGIGTTLIITAAGLQATCAIRSARNIAIEATSQRPAGAP